MKIYTSFEQIRETPFGNLVVTAAERFDDPDWAAERMDFLRYGYATSAFALFPEEVEERFGNKTIDQFVTTVIPRERAAAVLELFVMIQDELRLVKPPRFLLLEDLAREENVELLTELWQADTDFQNRVKRCEQVLRESLTYFNLQFTLERIHHGYQCIPDFNEPRTTLFDGITPEMIAECKAPIDEFAYGRGVLEYNRFGRLYTEQIYQPSDSPDERLQHLFRYEPELIVKLGQARIHGPACKLEAEYGIDAQSTYSSPSQVLQIEPLPIPRGYVKRASGLLVPEK